ncbi:putative pumilio protein 2 [Leishmania infantum JPCM5]|uniref:Pumilio_protein_2_-_putative n=2 Tax=Leishmania infantum TaxID=5671 RepID=A0A6L0X7V8_LEIIN|nr:putative pumilio protein 2 [Leishmania infantum JPCM5]CAC9481494.1 pumilio_protein_2_-_putative [Leishmania infantum]CAM67194.1 putative pumilio protein 2 [Leishmania infantum JPCM5]SUZ41068.1 pumilio_protein_2_-_putative [Leishmania infantum]|eukprot:XP_001464953.1 putative pumilio protein 2 [Leishmania infantum JPCM5]
MSSNWTAASGAHLRVEDIDWGSTGGDDMFTSNADDLLMSDPRAVRRAETAPMVLTIMGTGGSLCVGGFVEEVNPDEEYRYTEDYHQLYYSKNPRDPRMLPPLTRRRHHLVREARAPGAFAVSSGDKQSVPSTNGAVGDRIENRESDCNNAAAATSAATAIAAAAPEATEHLSSQALVKLYVDTFRPDWDYAQIKSHVCTFSRDQDGSRLVQRLLEKPENIVSIFNEVIEEFGELATDVFGNYVLQKMFDVVPKAENDANALQEIKEAKMLDRLTAKVRGHLLEYSVQTYGCRVMQKAVENMRAADRNAIIRELDGKIVEFVFDQNANHVVQKVVEVCPSGAQFVVDAFIPSLGDLACHAYGCRVLQRTFEKCHDVEGVNIRPLMEAVLSRVNEFTVHQYGNYVVQHAMLNAPEDLRHRFVVQLTPQLYALSCSKFASNVAERIVTTATEEERDAIIKELKKPLSDFQGGNYLVNMMQDTYANYVVQRFFEAVSPTQREVISELVQPHIGTINQSVYGRHLLRKMVSNNILTNTFLLSQGIDVSGPEYGGNANNSGHRSGGHRNTANGTSGSENRHNGGGSTAYTNRNGNGRDSRSGGGVGSNSSGGGNNNGSGGRAGRGGRGGNSNNSSSNNSNNQHSDGKNNAMRSNGGGNPNSMLVLQPQLQLQQPIMTGYMPMPQQYPYGTPYGIPQLQQQQPQAPQPAYMYPAAAAAPQLYQPQQAYIPQIAPSGFGAFAGAATFSAPMPPQQQAGNYSLRYGTPMQQSTPTSQPLQTPAQQQQQPTRRGGAQSPQVYVNGGYNGAGQAHQQQPSPNSTLFPASQQQQAFQANSDLADATLASGKGGCSGKGNTSAGVSSASHANATSSDKACAILTNSNTSSQQRAGYSNQRAPQQETGY